MSGSPYRNPNKLLFGNIFSRFILQGAARENRNFIANGKGKRLPITERRKNSGSLSILGYPAVESCTGGCFYGPARCEIFDIGQIQGHFDIFSIFQHFPFWKEVAPAFYGRVTV